MDKFIDFVDFLKREKRDEFYMYLSEIEEIIASPLCHSAYTHSAYWHHDGIHRFAHLIHDAGFTVSPDLKNKRVKFKRIKT